MNKLVCESCQISRFSEKVSDTCVCGQIMFNKGKVLDLGVKADEKDDHRQHHVGSSNYSEHKIQPYDVWFEYKLNPWDADLIKRTVRKKQINGMSMAESRIEDYEKMIHICQERLSHFKKINGEFVDTYEL